MPADYDDVEFGDIIGRYECPECGEGLVVEYRDGMPAAMLGLACPHGHVGLGVRIRDPASIDDVADTRRVPHCWECQEQITDVENPPETTDGHPMHPECRDSLSDRVAAEVLD